MTAGEVAPKPCTVLLLGSKYSDKIDTLAARFAGVEKEAVVKDSGLYDQIKITKDNITLQGLPEEFGRMPVFRQRKAAYQGSQAFIIATANAEREYDDANYYMEEIKKYAPSGCADKVILLGIHTTGGDAVPFAKNVSLAATLKLKYEVVDLKKLESNNEAEVKKLQRIVNDHVASVFPSTPKEEAKEEPTKGEGEVVKAADALIDAKQGSTWKRLISYIKVEVFRTSPVAA